LTNYISFESAEEPQFINLQQEYFHSRRQTVCSDLYFEIVMNMKNHERRV